MTNYTIHFYGVQFSNGSNVKKVDENEIVEPISEQEFNDLMEGDMATFFDTFDTIRARIEEHFGLAIKWVVDWDVMSEHK